MKRRLTVIASIICIVGGLVYAQQPASAPGPPKIAVLIITGQNGHNWRGTTPLLRKILEDTGKFEVRVTEEFRGAGPETLAPYDLVVLNYFERGRPELRWGEKTDAAFLDYVRSGKGVVVYHFSMAAFDGWTEYEKLSGGNWRPNNGHHSAPHNYVVDVKDQEHPITKGLKLAFPQTNDELYANLRWQPAGSYHVLATANDDHALDARSQLNAIQRELEIAARIQASILPREFCPERDDFLIYAEMTPARVVGGDFYDFFLIDPTRLGFLIGDVSGKGIPAALFMAVSRTLLQAIALEGRPPDECLRYANQVLGGQGEPGVYVTVFYGILHTDTGELEFCLGGHNPPYRITAAGNLQAICEPGGVVVGLLPDSDYQTGRVQLAPGDSMFLFTDGVPEAMDREEHFFTERHLKELLRASGGLTPKELATRVLGAVNEFTAGAEQSDDITVMGVRWR